MRRFNYNFVARRGHFRASFTALLPAALFLFGLLTGRAAAQPLHQHLLYSHPLTSSQSEQGLLLQNTDGEFTAAGWHSLSATSQLFITLPAGLPFAATFSVKVSNFDPFNQNINQKQPIIDLYSQPCGNKEIYETDGAWFHLISGTGYESGVPGEAGFKLWAAPRGVDSKDEERVMNDARWDPARTYEFTFIWNGARLWFLVDGVEKMELPYAGQVEPFRYIFLGKDNLIYGYTAQPGPLFSDLRIYGEPPGESPVTAITRPGYRAVRRAVGDQVYNDRSYLYTEIPARFSDYYWIMTANDDKGNTEENFLQFHTERALHLVVAIDASAPAPPAWMSGWKPVDGTILTDDAGFVLYEKEVPPGIVTLGGNGMASSYSMYLLLLRPLTDTGVDRVPPSAPTGVRLLHRS